LYLYRNQLKVVMRGLDPRIHALAIVASAWGDDMDAHGTSPWAEGPRIKSGHDDFELCNESSHTPICTHREFPGTALRESGNAEISVACP
jgi:hypothetical protein